MQFSSSKLKQFEPFLSSSSCLFLFLTQSARFIASYSFIQSASINAIHRQRERDLSWLRFLVLRFCFFYLYLSLSVFLSVLLYVSLSALIILFRHFNVLRLNCIAHSHRVAQVMTSHCSFSIPHFQWGSSWCGFSRTRVASAFNAACDTWNWSTFLDFSIYFCFLTLTKWEMREVVKIISDIPYVYLIYHTCQNECPIWNILQMLRSTFSCWNLAFFCWWKKKVKLMGGKR